MKKKQTLKLIYSIIMIIVMIISLSACGSRDEEQSTIGLEDASGKMETLAANNARLGFNILSRAMEQDRQQNILISPLSLYEDIGLLAYGAEGTTKEEIEDIILTDSAETAASNLHFFDKTLMPASVNIANSIWFNKIYIKSAELNQSYVNNAEQLFSAEIKDIAYDNSGVKQINKWVKKQTNGMIPEIIKELSGDEIMHLINALAFESEWEKPYEEIDIREEYVFNSAADETGIVSKEQMVTMLFSYGERVAEISASAGNVEADTFIKPYKDGRTAFVGILPKDGFTPEGVVNIFLEEDRNAFVEMCRSFDFYDGNVVVGIPEFTLDYSLDMSEILQDMGVNKAFTADADFSGIITGSDIPVSIGGVHQKTHIEVDRKGTKAAAVTDIVLGSGAATEENPPKIIILDRPFVYAIVDMETGIPYFVGVQYSFE